MQTMLAAKLLAAESAHAADGRFSAMHIAPFGAVGIRIDGEIVRELVFLEAPATACAPHAPLAREACRQLAAFFNDPRHVFDLPLAPAGTRFQRRVWNAIAAIPCGATRAYGELARELDSAPRAVGQACGANAYPLVIPCHRVVAAAGLGGFAHHGAGFHLRVKRWLLAHEAEHGA